MRGWLIRVAGLIGRAQRDRDLADEVNSHLDAHVADNIRSGMSPGAARRDALRRLGGMAQTAEAYRNRRSLPVVEKTIPDIRYALRVPRRFHQIRIGSPHHSKDFTRRAV